jgi:hypothetical protein
MSEGEGQAGAEISRAEAARSIADDLSRLAAAMEQDGVAHVAVHLRAMEEAQRALARYVAEAEQVEAEDAEAKALAQAAERAEAASFAAATKAAGWTEENLARLMKPNGPQLAAAEMAEAEPLTWPSFVEAVRTLHAQATVQLPDDAPGSERMALALSVAAVMRVQAMTKHLAAFLRSLERAKRLHDDRPGTAPDTHATMVIANALAEFLAAIGKASIDGVQVPLHHLLRMLEAVETGRRKPAFSTTAVRIGNRSATQQEEEVWGLAACALDAMMKAEPKADPLRHAMRVAAAASKALRKRIPSRRVMDWRERAMAGMRGTGKGFKQGHGSLAKWASYVTQTVENPQRGGTYDSAAWARVAETLEAAINSPKEEEQTLSVRENPLLPIRKKNQAP